MIKIGTVDMPTPSGYTLGIMDIVDAERNSQGKMFIELIATKYKIELSWNYLNQADMTKLLDALSPVSFSVTFFDAASNTNKTANFYKSDRSVPMYDYVNNVARYKDFKINLIEL